MEIENYYYKSKLFLYFLSSRQEILLSIAKSIFLSVKLSLKLV